MGWICKNAVMIEREQTECATDYIVPLAEGVELAAERLRAMQDTLGGLAVWAAYNQGDRLRDIAEDLERLARDARSAERELNCAAAEYHASLTPNFGEIRYNRLCNLAAIKRPKEGMGRRTKEIVIVDDTTIKSDRGIIVLLADEIAVLNKATKHRRWHLSAQALREDVPKADGGRRSMQQSEFRSVYSGLAAKLEFIAGESLFMRTGSGSGMVYVLSTAIQFVDERATQLPQAEVITENAEEDVREEGVVVVTTSEVSVAEEEVMPPAEQVPDDGDGPTAAPEEAEEPPEIPDKPVTAPEDEDVGTSPEVSDEPDASPPTAAPPEDPQPDIPKPEVTRSVIDTWRSVNEMAQATGLPDGIIAIFIDRNKHRLGRDFKSPQMRPRPHPTARGNILVQCYSPQFCNWAIASLEDAKRRLAEQDAQDAMAQQQENADGTTPES